MLSKVEFLALPIIAFDDTAMHSSKLLQESFQSCCAPTTCTSLDSCTRSMINQRHVDYICNNLRSTFCTSLLYPGINAVCHMLKHQRRHHMNSSQHDTATGLLSHSERRGDECCPFMFRDRQRRLEVVPSHDTTVNGLRMTRVLTARCCMESRCPRGLLDGFSYATRANISPSTSSCPWDSPLELNRQSSR